MRKKIPLLFILLFFYGFGSAQFLMDIVDTTTDLGKGMLAIYKKYDNLRISGYIQPQFQLAEDKGIRSFNGGDFGVNVNNRWMLRRWVMRAGCCQS